MRLGYSVLLQELVAATEVDYGDCALFQITCPICREAVFKSGKYGGGRQFLSHYMASKSNVDECELRVAAMTKSQIDEVNVFGRGQTLETFFNTFRTNILDWLCPNGQKNNPETIRKQVAWMATRPSFIVYSSYVVKTVKLNDLDKIWSQIISQIAADDSAYWVSQQKRFADDFLKHLLAPNSLSAWHFIFGLAFVLSSRLPKEWKDNVVFENDKKLKKFFTVLRNTEPVGKELAHANQYIKTSGHFGLSRSHVFASTAMGLVFNLLLTIPYVDIVGGTTHNYYRNLNFLLGNI